MSKILFRADAKPAIGTGDLVSLIHLAKTFDKKGWESWFMIRDSQGAKSLMADYAITQYEVIPDSYTPAKEVAELNDLLSENGFSHLFACITERPLTDYAKVFPAIVKGCINFDGVIAKDWSLVVNWNFPEPTLYKQENFPETRFLLGPEFVILPDNFDQGVIEKRTFKKPIQKLLISMGGADEFNLTTEVVWKIIDEKLNLHLTIILGAAFGEQAELKPLLESSGLTYECKKAVTDMFAEYMSCDAAIGTGGLTSSELVATHTPALLVAAYDHQSARCNYFHDQKMAIFLGDKQAYKSKSLKGCLSELETYNAANFSIQFHGREAIFDAFSQML